MTARRRPVHSATAAAVAALVVALAAACAPPATLAPSTETINPCTTQAAITCDVVLGHVVTPPSGTARGRLVVVFNGNGANPQTHLKINAALAGSGFHVINLRFPSDVSTGTACPDPVGMTNPNCFRDVRAEVVVGANTADPTGLSVDSPSLSVNAANSVTNRLLQLVNWLAVNRPTAGWDQYLQRSGTTCTHVDPVYGVCDLNWSKVVVMGHSLGAGVALYVARLHAVARVALLSGPLDVYHDTTGASIPAPWITDGHLATPSSAIFALDHRNEWLFNDEQLVFTRLGLATPAVDVDTTSSPYGGSHRLTTAVTPACADANSAHNADAQDPCTPGVPPTLTPAWVYLAGG